jgi:monoterpene epsilon-lactone hydrolase
MTPAVSLDQIAAAGARVQLMEGSSVAGMARRAAFIGANRLNHLIMRWVVWRGRRLLASGSPDEVAAFIARMRALHMRMDRPTAHVAALIDAEAVRSPGPRLGLPAPPTPAEWFAPRKGGARGTVFYVHGGSFVAHRSPCITALVAKFAAAAGASVFAPDYRLAPEHPCPAAINDIVGAWRWLKAASPEEPVVALAESAGAAILLAALQVLRDEGDELPAAVVLLSPWVDLSLQSWSLIAASIAGTSPYTMQSLALMVQLYLMNGRSPTDPLVSPVYGDFSDFPPLLVHASRADILYDDALRLAERVRATNGELTLRLWTDETHVWERKEGEQARRSIALAAEFIRRHLD